MIADAGRAYCFIAAHFGTGQITALLQTCQAMYELTPRAAVARLARDVRRYLRTGSYVQLT